MLERASYLFLDMLKKSKPDMKINKLIYVFTSLLIIFTISINYYINYDKVKVSGEVVRVHESEFIIKLENGCFAKIDKDDSYNKIVIGQKYSGYTIINNNKGFNVLMYISFIVLLLLYMSVFALFIKYDKAFRYSSLLWIIYFSYVLISSTNIISQKHISGKVIEINADNGLIFRKDYVTIQTKDNVIKEIPIKEKDILNIKIGETYDLKIKQGNDLIIEDRWTVILLILILISVIVIWNNLTTFNH